MKNFIIFAALIAVLFILPAKTDAATVSGASAKLSATFEKTEEVNLFDSRVEALENVFEAYNSPLVGQAIHYVKYADEFGIDWRLLPAISGLESGFGKHLMPGSHNAYGWGGGYIYFESWEEGIRVISKSLAERYYGRGATDVWSIGPIYAESPTWAVRVNGFINRIEKEYRRISVLSAVPTI